MSIATSRFMKAREVTKVTSPSAPVRHFSLATSQRRRKPRVYPTTASTLASLIALSPFAASSSRVASGFSISSGILRSSATMIGSTCRCSSVAMMAQLTSGRLSSSTWLCVTKSALTFGPTSPARLGFLSARPIHCTAGWRAATSPRNRPTRPPPLIARPRPLADFFMGALLLMMSLGSIGHDPLRIDEEGPKQGRAQHYSRNNIEWSQPRYMFDQRSEDNGRNRTCRLADHVHHAGNRSAEPTSHVHRSRPRRRKAHRDEKFAEGEEDHRDHRISRKSRGQHQCRRAQHAGDAYRAARPFERLGSLVNEVGGNPTGQNAQGAGKQP